MIRSHAQTTELSIFPESGIHGALISIYGNGFSNNTSNMTVEFGGVEAFILDSSPNKMIVEVPVAAPGAVEVVVTRNGFTNMSKGVNFTVLNPGEISTWIDYRELDFDLNVSVVNTLSTGDFDGDGDMDMVYDNGVSLNIAMIENGVIDYTVPISTNRTTGTSEFIFDLEVEDMNEDGRLDIVAGGSRLGWFENFGNDMWSNEQIISNASTSYDMRVFDVNQDLDADLVVDIGSEIVLFDNNGSGSFTESGSAVSTLLGIPIDWDEDGDIDMVTHGMDGMSEAIVLLENDGSGTSFTQSTITTTSLSNIDFVQVGDINEDARLDFIFTTNNGSAASLGYILNSASGFQSEVTFFNEGSFSTQNLELGDLDGNGLVDIARTKKNIVGGGIFEVFYGGIDPTLSYLREQLDSSIGGFDLALVDIENDGDMDILQESSRSGGYYPLFINALVGYEITSFSTDGDVGSAAIDESNATVFLEVNSSLDITAIAPNIGLSPGATSSPSTGVAQDFTNSVSYTVTSEAEEDKVWTVTINQRSAVPVLNFTTDDIGQTSVDINWDEATAAVGYELELSTNNTFTSLVSGFNPLVINSGSTISTTLSGLSESTNYYVRMRSKNKIDVYSDYSISETFLTRTATPNGLPATDITANSFIANWSDVNGATDYVLEVSSDNFASTVFSDKTSTTSADVTGLTGNTQYLYRVRAENSTGSSPYSNQVLVTTEIADTESPLIVLSSNNPESFESGSESQNISATITDENIGEVTFHYRSLTSTSFSSTTLTGQNDLYSITIPEADLNQVGIEYFFEATDLLGNASSSNRIKLGLSYPVNGANSQTVESIQKFGRTADDYQLISIPYSFTGSNSRVDVIFDEYGGNPDNRTWRIIRYDSDNSALVNLTGSYQVSPGEGYFFIAEEQQEVGVGEAVVNTEDPFTLTLKAGWNLIGNPYELELDWNEVLINNDAVSRVRNLRILDPSSSEIWPETTTLEKFQGAFVQADQDIDLTVTYQDVVGAGGRRARVEQIVREQPNWFLPITLEQNNNVRIAGVGMDSDAEESLDSFDELTLPRWLEYLEISFLHDGEKFSKFNKDVVGEQETKIWDFTVSSSESGTATLRWESENITNNVKLLDVSSGIVIDMRSNSSYAFDLVESRSFQLLYSVNESANFDFNTVTIGDAYPSPFIDSFSVPITLSSQDEHTVTFSLIDLSGQVVWQEQMNGLKGGAYLLESNPENLDTGVYLYKIVIENHADTYVQTKRITVK